MATLALASAGAAIGGAFGYAAAGWAAGSLLGNYLFAEGQDIEGPRLSDLSVQSSAYGAPKPRVYGSMRMAGNVIWSTKIKETKHEEDVGKGGPSSTQTTYTYSITMAIAFGEGPVDGIRRIWMNGQLVYSIADDTDISSAYSNKDGITVYTGSETQNPDPTIESYEGAGNVPGFRGTVYVVFEDLELEDFGNRPPNVEAEVVYSGEDSYVIPGLSDKPAYGENTYSRINDGLIDFWESANSNKVTGSRWTIDGTKIQDLSRSFTNVTNIYGPIRGTSTWFNGVSEEDGVKYRVLLQRSAPTYPKLRRGDGTLLSLSKPIYTAIYANESIYGILGSEQNEEGVLIKWDEVYLTPIEVSFSGDLRDVYEDAEGFIWVYEDISDPSAGKLHKLDQDDLSVLDTWDAPIHSWAGIIVEDGLAIVGAGTAGSYTVARLEDDGTHTVLESGSVDGLDTSFHPMAVNRSMLRVRDQYISFELIANGGISVAEIVGDLCEESGLSSSDYDTSQLSDTVHGYARTRPMSSRRAIEPLQQAFWFDAIESDWQIKFIPRGGSSVVTITDDDLAAHEYDSEQPAKLEVSRQQELELPREIRVRYFDSNADYRENVQKESRIVTSSDNSQSLDLPIAMTNDRARQAAHVILSDAWSEREKKRFITGPEYEYLDPADVVTVVADGVSNVVRINKVVNGAVIEFDSVTEEQANYDVSVSGFNSSAGEQTIGLSGPTNLVLLDIPILQKTDNNAGYYVAVSGYFDSWRGSSLYHSVDDESYSQLISIFGESVIGTTANELPDGPTSIIDESGSVNIQIPRGELSSITDAVLFDGESNAAAIGSDGSWEIVQFRDAVLESDGTYTISHLIRGRLGTEHSTGGHASGDTFVLLSEDALRRVAANENNIGNIRYYKGVSIGRPVVTADTQEFSNDAVGLKPYSPAHLKASDNNDGTYDITWIRRGRYGGEWRDYVDVPLGEDSELYRVKVFSGGTEQSSIDVSSESATVTASSGDTIKVAQVSETVGAGYYSEITV